MLEEALTSAELGICIKDASRAVLAQNDRCRSMPRACHTPSSLPWLAHSPGSGTAHVESFAPDRL